MELDTDVDLVWIGGSVPKRCIDLRPRHDRILDERSYRIGFCRQVLDPHRDLPHIGASDQRGAPTGGAVTEGNQGMFIAPDSLIGVPPQAIRQGLARSARRRRSR